MKYSLQRHKPKLVCPSCGRKKCFTPYEDTATGQILDPTCGICDHLNSCGYHLPPRQYFATTGQRPEPHPSALDIPQRPEADAPRPFVPLPPTLVAASHSTASTFCQWLTAWLGDKALDAIRRYRLGATRRGDVIFWQIDSQQRVHGGKIMSYTPDGHRCGNPSWVHTRLQNRGLLDAGWQLHQCLFGEHLLPATTATPILVESEKTAVICAAVFPEYVWLASGGCQGLSEEKMAVLRGRHFVVLPDSGCYDKWCQRLAQIPGLSYAVSRALEAYPANTDLADLIT